MKSKVDSNWDVMKYKYHYELEHQWELKRRFVEAHKTKYPEDRLICLAQLFCNVHFMGCSYEDNIMKLIKELSEGIAEKNTKWEKQSFVSASDAVEDRVKNRLNAPQRGPPQQQHTPVYSSGVQRAGFQQNENRDQEDKSDVSQSKFIKFIQSSVHGEEGKQQSRLWGDSSQTNYAAPEPEVQTASPIAVKRPASPIEEDEFYANKRLKSNFTEEQIKKEVRFVVDSGPFGRVVLFQSAVTKESNIAIMERTAAAAQMRLNYNYMPPAKQTNNKHTDSTTCKLSLDGMFLSSATGFGQKSAKDMACKMAIEHLKETSFTILVKAAFTNESGSEVDRNLSSAESSSAPSSASVHKPISDDNIGNKLLKLMGWSGGGLGKSMQGIEEPIVGSGTIKREGLGGSIKEGDFNRRVHALLQEYAMGDSKDDLVFSTDFSKEERKAIHEASRKYNLKSRSYGNENNRQLVIFKKARPLEIVEDLLMCGCETPKYKLLPPKSMIDRFTL
uniref:NF-kappa-B-repressing factor n=1 Tax=Lygus hesperus TaxID=30085 RepID=A0A0A9YLJ3_LYGHE